MGPCYIHLRQRNNSPGGVSRLALAERIDMENESQRRDGAAAPGRLQVSSRAAQSAPAREPATYAALDLGTNNCRLLIACPNGDGFRVVDSFSRIIRLGEGISITGRMSDAAIERALSALQVCRDKIRAKRANRLRLIATEACRSAANGKEFCDRVSAELSIDLEVIDRETEAKLAVTGCLPLLDPEATGAILFDIGGGSSEIVRLDRDPSRPDAAPTIAGWVSLPLGVVTLAEGHGGTDVTPQIYAAMVKEVGEHLRPFAQNHASNLDGLHLLGTSGTVTTVAGIFLNLPRYDRRRIDGIWMNENDVTRTVARLRSMSYQERVNNACIGTERGDLVLAGCAILEAIRNAFPCRRLRIADRGLREGMLVQMMREDGVLKGS
jgi:exopolyphosphatase/guanosine-5'-triphosphate,3'-diphosphate pyrophosphatase